MRTSTAECRPNAPMITPARPRLALQRSTDHRPRALQPCLLARSHRHLPRLWRRQHRRPRCTRLVTAQRRFNAPRIAPARLSHAEKPFVLPSPHPDPLVGHAPAAPPILNLHHTSSLPHPPPPCAQAEPPPTPLLAPLAVSPAPPPARAARPPGACICGGGKNRKFLYGLLWPK